MEIVAGSRLHFGLLHVPTYVPEPASMNLQPMRAYGGAGLMIEEPALRLEARKAASWSAEGPLADEIMAFAEACRGALGNRVSTPLTIRCQSAPPRHAGFGSGTQLGLSVARLITEMNGDCKRSVEELARLVGRGKRSAVGTHGFALGGFLLEAGKLDEASLAAPLVRYAFPESWPVVIVLLQGAPSIHGSRENRIFGELQQDASALRTTEALCRILLLGVLPALSAADYEAFAESLFEFNRKAGERFARAQGGEFASGTVSEIIQGLRRAGCPAVGQSSWGPAVFAICRDKNEAARVTARARQLFESADVFTTEARNQGADLFGR